MAVEDAETWAVRRDAGPLAAGDQIALDQWLAEDPRREGELLRAEAVLHYLDLARGGEGAPSIERPEGRRFSRRSVIVGGSAALAVAASVAGVMIASTPTQEFATARGELRRLPLADGSVAIINTDSRIRVAMAPEERLVRVATGEAWFQVEPDTRRPFVVEAGEVRVRAVGTAFSVRRHEAGVEVLVTEGTVEVWAVGREAGARRMTAGVKGFVPATDGSVRATEAPEEIARNLAWRTGEIALNGETVAQAVDEFNRYNARKLVVSDPAIAGTPLVGFFRTTEPETFGRTVAEMTGAIVVIQDGEIRIER